MSPGDLVIPSKRVRYKGGGQLIVWRDFDGVSNDQADVVEMGELLVVVEVKKTKNEYPAEGWDRSIRVLTQRGALGWVGSGWVSKISPTPADR